jgi:hypothetical protein
MATFYEIYQNYLQNPYSGVNALPGVNPSSGIMNTNTISPIGGDSMGVSPVASISTNPNVTNTTPGTGIMGTNVNFSDIAKAIGFAMNPALGIANLAATQVLENLLWIWLWKQWVLVVLAERIVILLLLEFLVEMIHRQQEQLMQQILETWDQKPLMMQLQHQQQLVVVVVVAEQTALVMVEMDMQLVEELVMLKVALYNYRNFRIQS